jgi:hypothetical protein
MCFKPEDHDRRADVQERKVAEPPRQEPWRNTRPRGNQEPSREDLERSLERLESLVGH